MRRSWQTNTPGKPRIAVSMGDPAGIGPELCLHVLSMPKVRRLCMPIVFGNRDILTQVARRTGQRMPNRILSLQEWKQNVPVDSPAIVHCDGQRLRGIRPGKVQRSCGKAAADFIVHAVQAAMNGRVAAVVTAPIHKEALRLAGIPHAGHTEMLAQLTGATKICMTMASDRILVALATAHVPYAEVPRHLSVTRVFDVICLIWKTLRQLGLHSPRISVCGINPHAGEHGVLGSEENLITRAIRKAQHLGIAASGPLPPDTAFIPKRLRKSDAYVAMYHDQGLIPFKMLAFETGVNITLGLPIVRTSPDHGTAFDIAWKGVASPESMVQSIVWACRLATLAKRT